MKIATKIILLLFCAINFSSCNIGVPLRYEPSDNNDTYTIQGTTEAWYGNGKTVEGKWTTYEAVQQQKADTPAVEVA